MVTVNLLHTMSDLDRNAQQKVWRAARIAKGFCSVCNQIPVPGKKFCVYHRDQSRRSDTRRRSSRITAGLCIHCMDPVVNGIRGIHEAPNRKRTTCDACAARKYNTPLRRFKGARAATRSTVGWSLTFEEWYALVIKPCHYCGSPHLEQSGRGLDRLNNKNGYHNDNVVSCCPECNMVRNNIFTPEEMRLLGEVIHKIKLARITSTGKQL